MFICVWRYMWLWRPDCSMLSVFLSHSCPYFEDRLSHWLKSLLPAIPGDSPCLFLPRLLECTTVVGFFHLNLCLHVHETSKLSAVFSLSSLKSWGRVYPSKALNSSSVCFSLLSTELDMCAIMPCYIASHYDSQFTPDRELINMVIFKHKHFFADVKQ